MRSASLTSLEQHLIARLLELDQLHQTRPSLPTAMARAEAGERIDRLLDEIAEIQRMIDTRPATTLLDAAVKLRRLGAYIRAGPGGAAATGGSERGGEGGVKAAGIAGGSDVRLVLRFQTSLTALRDVSE